LRLHTDAAVDRRGIDIEMPPVRAGALEHLLRELPGRHEDERPDSASIAVARQALQDRQHERRRLAGAGLRRPDQITPGEGEGDGFELNGGRLLVALFGYGPNELGREPE